MRIARRLLHALIIVLTLIVGATAAAVIVSQTAWFKNWLRGYIVAEANKYLNGQLSIQRLGGNLFFGVELENIGISMDGSEVVAVEDLGLDYNVFQMITKGLSLNEVRVNKPVLYLRREGDTWSITRLVKKQEQEADREGPRSPISIDDIGVSDGSIVIDDPVGTSGVKIPHRIESLDAKLAFKYEPVRYSIDITHVSFRGSEPAIGLNALSGGVAVRNDTAYVEQLALRTEETSLSIDGAVEQYLTTPTFKMQVSSDKVSLPELARVVPSLAGINLQPAFELMLNGPLDRLGIDMSVRSSAGQVTGTLVADLKAPGQAAAGQLSVRHLDLAPIVNDPRQKTDITADARFDLQAEEFANIDSLRGTASIASPRVVAAGYTAERVNVDTRIDGRRVNLNARASAYGTSATAIGRVVVPQAKEPLAFDVHGQARGLDLRKLPRDLKVPPVESNLNADYHVAGTLASSAPASSSGRTPRTPARSMAVTGDAQFAESSLAGARIAGGSRVGFDMRGQQIAYNADATIENVDLQRIGTAFNVPALASEKYQSTINAHVTANGSGTTPRDMNVTASGSLTDSSVMGGRIPQVTFEATVANDSAHLRANGSFADFDPAVASGKAAMNGRVGGSLEVEATVEGLSSGVTANNVAGTVRATLDPSMVGGLAVDRATVDADYRDMTGEIRQLDITGRDVNVTAKGTVALNDTGESNLTFHADTPRLEEIGKLVGTPVSGIAKVDGTLTGNRSELQASGTLVGNGLKYQNNGALSISSAFSARVPDLTVGRGQVDADTRATFITVAGQNINELAAKTTYADKRITFDATAKQPDRDLGVAGSITLHPEHQEIHLDRLMLQTAGQQWTIAEGTAPAINYAQDAISIENLRLVNGPQEIVADGTFGRPGDTLKVALNRVDLAGVDALLLRPPQFAGELNGSATISGTKAAPEAKAEFAVTQGAFRQFRYESLGGTLNYSGKAIALDTKLQQNPAQWISANGYLPVALFSRTPDSGKEPVDLTIESSPLDLGLVQGFTTALTDVKGTLEAHVRVTGTADDPQPSGSVSIADGALTVAPTGVPYAHIAGVVELQPDRVHIPLITVLDNHHNSLTLTGDLSVPRRQVGGFQVWMNASDFKVIDNKMGNVRLQSAIEISGDLRAPRVRGDLGMTTGQLNLDEIIAVATSSAYPTEPTQYGDVSGTGEQAPASAFDALEMDLRITVPNDLVIKASDLQAPGAPVSLGALNVTVGGDLVATKDPGASPRLRGIVNTIRGNYDFQGRRFEILRDGSVRFEGLEEFNPSLDIRTRRVIQGVEARVNIRGTLKQPEIELSSTPPLEQADILALIVFNQPLNQLGEGQQVSLAKRAEALAAGAVASQLAQSIGNALNLDTFEINLAPESGGGPEVTLGQQLGQNLYVRVQQGVGDQTSTNFILEYELTNWLRLQTNVVQGSSTQQSLFRRAQSTGVDLIFFFSF